ncbi:hypothetical protein LZ318_32860 [Saccharopolyspora indica]|uniref:hypothetical protein n=1 Tax=Saccharopolyspora indica TaxID=1229659 RepID=UPI0022EA2269|nr:hypothetical protein [Saccharopolyspora indica]MDA3643968.1 hypothetical protein [Saccharopolyspora indica]
MRVKSIDVRRKSAAAAEAGEEAGVYLDGITARDLPTVPGGEGGLIDSDAVAGIRLVSA